MTGKLWYDVWPGRFVLEYLRVKARYNAFQLVRADSVLQWHGEVCVFPPGVLADPLKVIIEYPEAFPASAPRVQVVSPKIDPTEIGHAWHRWPSGNICFIKPRYWQISTTTDEIIAKVEDWYFNYLAKKAGLIENMPDVGRANIETLCHEGT